jgi:hypothetical protein
MAQASPTIIYPRNEQRMKHLCGRDIGFDGNYELRAESKGKILQHFKPEYRGIA